jgi:hypothetical protein
LYDSKKAIDRVESIAGVEGLRMHLHPFRDDSLAKRTPTYTISVNWNLTAVELTVYFKQANAGVDPPRAFSEVIITWKATEWM